MSLEQPGWNVHFSYDATTDEQSVFVVERNLNGRRYILNIHPSGEMFMTEMTGQKVEPTFRSSHIALDSILKALVISLKDRGIDPDAESASIRARLADSQGLADRLLTHFLTEDSKQRAKAEFR